MGKLVETQKFCHQRLNHYFSLRFHFLIFWINEYYERVLPVIFYWFLLYNLRWPYRTVWEQAFLLCLIKYQNIFRRNVSSFQKNEIASKIGVFEVAVMSSSKLKFLRFGWSNILRETSNFIFEINFVTIINWLCNHDFTRASSIHYSFGARPKLSEKTATTTPGSNAGGSL